MLNVLLKIYELYIRFRQQTKLYKGGNGNKV
jgi:hypothetical protein